jgi:hypothetical protein
LYVRLIFPRKRTYKSRCLWRDSFENGVNFDNAS